MKTSLMILSFAFGLALGCIQDYRTVKAQEKASRMVLESKASKYRGAGQDENIKDASELNDPNAVSQALLGRGGEKTRGEFSTVHVENWTNWKVKIYGNGTYIGTVASYGTMDFLHRPGAIGLYARAELLDGSSLYWGPTSTQGDAGKSTTWKLR